MRKSNKKPKDKLKKKLFKFMSIKDSSNKNKKYQQIELYKDRKINKIINYLIKGGKIIMKIPQNHIPGTNPYKSLPKKPIINSKKKISKKQMKINSEIMKSQEIILKLYMRRLQKKDQIMLQNFTSEKHRVGSKIFNNLPKILKEIILIMNIESLKIIRKNTKNPFKILYVKFSSWMLESLLKAINKDLTSNKKENKKLKKRK